MCQGSTGEEVHALGAGNPGPNLGIFRFHVASQNPVPALAKKMDKEIYPGVTMGCASSVHGTVCFVHCWLPTLGVWYMLQMRGDSTHS